MTQPPPPPPPPGYGPPPGPPSSQVRQTSSDAVVALVLAILSWVVCPVILAVVALVFAGKARTAITASGGWLEGSGMVTAAKIIAWVNIVFAVLTTIFIIVVTIIAANSSQTDFSSGNAVMLLLG